MKKKTRILTIIMAAALAFTAFTAVATREDTTIESEASSSSVKLSASSKTIGYKQSFNLSVKNAGSKSVKWSTSNKKVAKIKKVSKTKYKVTGVKPGTATIKAKIGGKTYKCKVTVSRLCHSTQNLAIGSSHTLGFKGANGRTVKWSTSNKSVATVKKVSNTKYKVTGKKKGTTTIKAKVGGKTYKCKVTVTNPKLSKSSKSISVGDSFNLSVSGGKGSVKWSTSDKSVASIKKVSNTQYKVTGKKKGTATIKAKVDGKTLSCTVTVKKAGSSSSCSHSNWQIISRDTDAIVKTGTSVYVCQNCGFASDIDYDSVFNNHIRNCNATYTTTPIVNVRYECTDCGAYYWAYGLYRRQGYQDYFVFKYGEVGEKYTPSAKHYNEYWANH